MVLGRRCDCGEESEVEGDFAESEQLVTHMFDLNHNHDYSRTSA